MHVLATVATWATLASADWASTTVANRSAGEQLASQLEARLHPQNYSLESTHLEDIRSFFWWDGALQEEDEVRATIDSDVPFSVLLEGLSADHPYDLPMIVSSAHLDSQEDHSSHKHAMALALVNGTTMEVAHGLAKSIVEEPAEEEVPFDREHFSAMVKESAIQPHHSSVAADSRAPRDLTEEWQQFLSENPTIGQVYRLGRLTVTESSSRPVRVTVNITLTNLGSSTWPAHAAVQIAHGADLGMDTLPLGRVTSPGEHRKVTLHLKVPRQADAPSCIWALSLDGRVFGVLLLLELDWIESTSAGLLGQATDNLQSARAYVHEVRLQAHDQALLPDLSRVGDVTEEWSADLAPTSVTQAYRIGSIEVASAARGAVLDLVLALENIGQDEWPEGTELKLVSGHSFGFESWDLDTPVHAGSVVQVAMPLKIDHKDAMVEESVWALSYSFGPLLVLELRYNPR